MGVKKFVSLFGFQNRKVLIDIEATKGATVGTDLTWADGSVVQEDEIRNSSASNGSSGSTSTTTIGGTDTPAPIWKYILDVPDIIKSIGNLTSNGWLRNDNDVISALDWPYVRKTVQAGESFTIPADFQLLVAEEFRVDGSVSVDGELVVL